MMQIFMLIVVAVVMFLVGINQGDSSLANFLARPSFKEQQERMNESLSRRIDRLDKCACQDTFALPEPGEEIGALE